MKYLVLILLLLSTLASEAFADSTEMRAFKNYDKKIKALENYTVTYTEPGQKVSVPARQRADDSSMQVKLVSKKKS